MPLTVGLAIISTMVGKTPDSMPPPARPQPMKAYHSKPQVRDATAPRYDSAAVATRNWWGNVHDTGSRSPTKNRTATKEDVKALFKCRSRASNPCRTVTALTNTPKLSASNIGEYSFPPAKPSAAGRSRRQRSTPRLPDTIGPRKSTISRGQMLLI